MLHCKMLMDILGPTEDRATQNAAVSQAMASILLTFQEFQRVIGDHVQDAVSPFSFCDQVQVSRTQKGCAPSGIIGHVWFESSLCKYPVGRLTGAAVWSKKESLASALDVGTKHMPAGKTFMAETANWKSIRNVIQGIYINCPRHANTMDCGTMSSKGGHNGCAKRTQSTLKHISWETDL